MATIDPSIAMGYKPVQIENPLNQLAAYSQIQGAQQGQQMNMLKMQEYQRGLEEENKLRTLLSGGGDINSPDIVRQMYGISPTKGLEFQKQQSVIKKSGLEATGLELKNFTDSMSQFRNALDMVRTPEALLAWQDAVHKNPLTGPTLANMGMPYESVKQQLLAELQKPGGFEAALTQSKLGATKFAELNKPNIQNVTRGGVSEQIQTPGMGGAPVVTRTAAVTPTIADTIAQQRLNADLNPDVQASLSTAREIGKLAAGQSPLAPKVIAATQGKIDVGDLTTIMGNSYAKLNELKGITSTARSGKSNLGASTQSSMVGQLVGGALGTQEQSERDFIKSQRPILVQAIVKATGITAGQINSNAELKNLLDAATDPGKGYESNARSLNELNKRFGTGKEVLPLAPNSSNIDALLEKYK